MKTATTINGRFVPESKAVISVFDNALLYAEGLFETLLGIEDRPIFTKEHLARLHKGAKVIGLKLPVSDAVLVQWMKKTLKAHPDRVKKLRLTMTSGESARWVGKQGKPQLILSASPHEIPREPFRLIVSDFKVDHASVFRNIKTLSYVISAAALRQAKERKFDDAILLNERNEVAEVTSANIFWSHGKRVYTPPLSAGCLDGITRKFVLKEADKVGIKIVERRVDLSGLLRADEIFISSSLKLVAPVSEIVAGSKTHRFALGPVAQQLSVRFDRLVGV
jgi:branched-subunit amino acid aminotransferase/4-amino-4-deoxychorismate lyase